MSLFQHGTFTLHSGARSNFKIDCDALDEEDWAALALLIASRMHFSAVEGVPRGGLKLAAALQPYCTKISGPLLIVDDVLTTGTVKYKFVATATRPLLIVDDVLTTGASMEAQRAGRSGVRGVVVFARGPCPHWIEPLWRGIL